MFHGQSYRLPRKLLVLRYDDGWGFDFTLIPPGIDDVIEGLL